MFIKEVFNTMDKLEISSLQDFITIIDKLKHQFSHSKMGMDFFYRGLNDSAHELLPNIYRETIDEYTKNTHPTFLALEYEILCHFIKEASCYISRIEKDDYLPWLVYAQHFGAPTRLLDFTSNPLVALFFCCKDEQKKDGVVWVLNGTNYQQFISQKSEYLKGKKKFSRQQILNDILQNIKDKKSPCMEYPCTYLPYYIDQRMVAQESRFLIWGSNNSPLGDMVESNNYMVINKQSVRSECLPDTRFLFKITILNSCKRQITEQLGSMGINEKSIFPGIDSIGRYTANYYRFSYDDNNLPF